MGAEYIKHVHIYVLSKSALNALFLLYTAAVYKEHMQTIHFKS